MSKLVQSVRRHFLNIPGKKPGRKFLLFESDDWGSERIPSRKSLERLESKGIDMYRSPFNQFDSLEGADDLTALFEVLIKFRDSEGNHPVITANSITANPDYSKIRDTDFSEFFFENTLQTYKNKEGCGQSFEIIKEGMASGIYHPQFHGREHLNVKQWLLALKSGDRTLHHAFEEGIYGIDLEAPPSNRSNFMAAFNGYRVEEIAEYEDIIEQGTGLFEDMFGYRSSSFIAPCYVWHPRLEATLKRSGIKYLQGLPVQLVPNGVKEYGRVFHYQGQMNRIQQRYFVRNCFFEPSLNPHFNYIEDALDRLRTIFFWGKPAIIGTHRINYIGSIDENNRKQNLKLLSEFLKRVLKSWPDVVFTTTDKLGDLYQL